MTAVNVSNLSAHDTSKVPLSIQVNSSIVRALPLSATSMNSQMERRADTRTAPAVTIWDPRSPIRRPKNPAMIAASSGRKIVATSMIAASALHHIDVVHRDGAAVAEVDDENGKTNGGLGGGDGQDEHCEHLTDKVIEEHRERHQIDVDRQQDQLNGHQDDDDVLPV